MTRPTKGTGITAPNVSADVAFTYLGLAPGASPVAVRAAYHARAKNLHPDAGGDAAEFTRANHAYVAALRYATHETCPECVGGFKSGMRGFTTTMNVLKCEACGGTGLRHRDA